MKIELQDKAILVTGSNSGIGFAIASELLNAGAKVALHFNANSDGVLSLEKQFPSLAKSFQCDFSNSASIPEFFDQVLSWSDGLDVLINNAGMSIMNSIDNTDEEWIHNWNTIMNINLLSTGILSERDLSRSIYAEKFNLTMPITHLMTKNLVTCDLNTSVTELMKEMTEKKIRHILIMDSNKLLGIVSIGDVVNHLISKIKEENKNLKDYINSY